MTQKEIRIKQPKPKRFSFYDDKIGAYKDEPQTVDRFVPRFSYSDQLKMFKANDGSKNKKGKIMTEVFVYGTLKKGGMNHHFFKRW